VSNVIAEILERAADLIDTGHLVKKELWDGEGGYCSVGAVRAVVESEIIGTYYFTSLPAPLAKAAVTVLYEHGVPPEQRPQELYGWPVTPWDGVVAWNNAQERTADEVVEAMRQAAKYLHNEAVPA
jgi:hypothetical protein